MIHHRASLEEAPSPFLPTLERARAQQISLPPGEPTQQERWAALVVLSTFVRRTSWRDEIVAFADSVAHLSRSAPAAPTGFERGSWVSVEGMETFGACPDCLPTPGQRPCRVCRGSGQFTVYGTDRILACSCKGAAIQCPTCRGQASASRIHLRYYQDEPRHLRELLVPSHLPCHAPLFALETAMEQAIDIGADPPEELRCHDLTGRAAGTAYRGGERLVRPTFHGHDFGDTIDRTLEAFKGLSAGAQIVRYEVRAYAWPILRLRFENPKTPATPHDLALYLDRHGAVRVVGE